MIKLNFGFFAINKSVNEGKTNTPDEAIQPDKG
jgi:hypothetical protein